MLTATPVFMEVRPFQVSHLCFEVGGILQESFVELGAEVSAFDFGDLYASFRKAVEQGSSGPDHLLGRLNFDSLGIDSVTRNTQGVQLGGKLAKLRAEAQRAALDKAINARSNAVITKYSGVAGIIDVMRKIIPLRGASINRLSSLSDGMMKVLDTAYSDAKRTGAVTTTESQSHNDVNNNGSLKLTNDADPPGSHAEPGSTQASSTKGTEDQHVTTTNVEFRAPIFENDARNERAQISLGKEVISFAAESHYLDRLEVLFAQELASIDSDVNRLQVAYLNTILLSPIDGTVTGVYKYPGDSVSAGEPVFRVENDAIVLIVANLVCRGPVLIGQILSITTTLFDGTGSPMPPINAAIVAARGLGDDDQWEVIGKVSNIDGAKNKIFPLGYRFDIDSAITQVSILAPNEI